MMKIEKFIYMADGFYVYKMEDGYAVKDQFGYTLKTGPLVFMAMPCSSSSWATCTSSWEQAKSIMHITLSNK